MVIVLNEKAEPPPYTLVDPSNPSNPKNPPDLPPRPSRDGRPAQSIGGNFLHVKRNIDNILGNWTVDPTLPPDTPSTDANGAGPSVEPSSRPSSSKSASRPSIRMETNEGKIDVSLTWVGGDKTTPLPRGTAEVVNRNGPISVVTTSRPSNLPLHILAASHKKGDVTIRLPENFRGVLALRGGSGQPGTVSSSGIHPRLFLSSTVNERVTCTRETAQTIKSKTKGKGKAQQDPGDLTSDDLGGITFEYLIGADLEPSDLNRAPIEKGPGALDYVQVDVRQGSVFIYTAEDGQGWMATALCYGGERASLDLPSSRPPMITIQREEPRWLRKLGKLSSESTSLKEGEHKVGEIVHGIAGWLYTSCQQSVTALVNLKQASSSSLNVPATNKPRSASTSSTFRPQTDSTGHTPTHSPSSSGSAHHLSSAPTSPRTEVSSLLSSSSTHLAQGSGSPTLSHTVKPSAPPTSTVSSQHLAPPSPGRPPQVMRHSFQPASHMPNSMHRRSYTPDGNFNLPRPAPEQPSGPYPAETQTLGRNREQWAPTHHMSRSAECIAPTHPLMSPYLERTNLGPPPQHPIMSHWQPNHQHPQGKRPSHSQTHPQPHNPNPRHAHIKEWLRQGNELHDRLIPMFTGGGGVRDWEPPRQPRPAPPPSGARHVNPYDRHPPSPPFQHSQNRQHPQQPPQVSYQQDHRLPDWPGVNHRRPSTAPSPTHPCRPTRSRPPPPMPVPVPGAALSTWPSGSSVASRSHTMPSPAQRSKKLTKKDRGNAASKSTPDLRDEARRIEKEAASQAGKARKLSRRK